VNERLCCPRVEATAWSARGAVDVSNQATLDQVGVTATLDGGVYRIVTTRQEGLPEQVGVHLSIAVPSAGAITVYNRGGPVMIVGAAGAVQVENGRGPVESEWWDDDAWIQLRTPAAIDQPVALVTDSGDVAIILGPAARGALDLQSPAGIPNARARVGTFDQFRATGHSITARYNDGANPILLRTDNGDATALMIEHPESYSMSMRERMRLNVTTPRLR